MKVIIAGGRDFNNYTLLKLECISILQEYGLGPFEIVSGGASGADYLGNKFAVERGFEVKYFPADWSNLGKAAGPIRNREMAEYADMLIAFWDGESRGTKNMIDEAKKRNLKVHIINYERNI